MGLPMLRTAIEAVLLAWLAWCLWRVFTASGNAIDVRTEAAARCPRSFAFATYLKVREFYLELSPAHLKYQQRDPAAGAASVIDVCEKAGFQRVEHAYRIAELEPETRMVLVSERSRVCVLGLFRGETRSEVEFRFSDGARGDTVLGLHIRIVFPTLWRHLLARLFFTQAIWQAHAQQEMRALARLVEARYAQRAGQVSYVPG